MGSAVKYQRTLFEPEHELFRESYRAFLDRHVAPHHEEWEKAKIVDRGVWLEAGKQGFLGMAVPEEYGGGGMDTMSYSLVIEEISRACANSGVILSVNNSLVCDPIQRFGSEQQKREFAKQQEAAEMEDAAEAFSATAWIERGES